jgi:predicted homoserine dehydrogenase-like protein
MIIIDNALKKLQSEGKSIKVGMIGSGFMGRGIALQICRFTPGMELVAISNRTVSKAEQAYKDADITEVKYVDSVSALEDCIVQ